MSIQHMDNFSLYGTGNASRTLMLNGMYADFGGFLPNSTVAASPDGMGQAFTYYGDNGVDIGFLRLILSSSQSIVGMASRIWMTSVPSTTSQRTVIYEWRDVSNNRLARLYVGTLGNLIVENAAGVTKGDTLSPTITANAFWHIEAKYNGATGEIKVRVEGIDVLTATGLTTPTSVAQVCLGPSFNGVGLYHKDFVVWDGSGTLNNDFLGAVQVYSLIPDSDVAANWARNTGSTNYSNIDETPANDETDYIYAVSPGIPSADRYGLNDLPVDVTSVKGLMTVHRSRKTDGGDGNVQVGFVSGGSTQLLTDRPITTAYTYFKDISETDPATGSTWTPSGVNNVNFRINRTL